jgi:hypothetical protein
MDDQTYSNIDTAHFVATHDWISLGNPIGFQRSTTSLFTVESLGVLFWFVLFSGNWVVANVDNINFTSCQFLW